MNHVKISQGSRLGDNIFFEGYNYIGIDTILSDAFIGKGAYIGERCSIHGVKIGRFTCIGPNVVTAIGRHPTKNWISIHPAFFSTKQQAGFTFVEKDSFEEIKWIDESRRIAVSIGNDVWVGASSTICDGVKIGNGAIIGANSLVIQDIPPFAIAVGSPAKVIKYRFTEDEVLELQKSRWWDRSDKWLRDNHDLFKDISNIRKFTL